MKPIFFARGPNIKKGYDAFPFNSVDIYPLVCELLGIEPSPNNGTLDNTKEFIKYTRSTATWNYARLINAFVVSVFLRNFV